MSSGRKKKSQSNGVASFLIIILVLLIMFGIWLFLADRTMVFDMITGSSFVPDSEMHDVIENIPLTNKGARILNASMPEIQESAEFNANCPVEVAESTSTLGCFYNHRIYVYAINNEELGEIKTVVTAHELLHAAWERLNPWDQSALYEDIEITFEKNRDDLAEHMELYQDAAYYNELHSIIGTQVPDDKMTPRLRAHYAKYFTNRERIVAYFNEYNDVFEEMQAKVESLAKEIAQISEILNRDIENYNAAYNQLNQDIETFNRRAENSGFSSHSEFSIARNNLMNRQSYLRQEYADLMSDIDYVNERIDEYNESVLRSSQLFESINSSVLPSSNAIEEK